MIDTEKQMEHNHKKEKQKWYKKNNKTGIWKELENGKLWD